MRFSRLAIDGLILAEPNVYEDNRGAFFEAYNATAFRNASDRDIRNQLSPVEFVQDNIAFNRRRNTIRGLHYQDRNPQAKFVTCLKGAILDVVVDIRPNSPTFGRWVSVRLDDRTCSQLFVPRGFAHGYRSLTDDCVVMYKADAYYDPAGYRGLLWNDAGLNVDWELGPDDSDIVISEQDANWTGIASLERGALDDVGTSSADSSQTQF
jgi:dTDP-4-dehydrorhamnose 3,5-epimerase